MIESLRKRWFVQASLATIYNYTANREKHRHSLKDEKRGKFVALDVKLVLISHVVL